MTHCNFYVGQKVVCTPRNPNGWRKARAQGFNVPIKGEVYTIRSIYLDPNDPGLIGVHLMEVTNRPHLCHDDKYRELGWPHYEFEPVTDISVFEKALETV